MSIASFSAFLRLDNPDGSHRLIRLGAFPFIIGRAPEVNLQLVDQIVSRRHACLLLEADRLMLVDLGSLHGTLLNSQQVAPNEPCELNDGDCIDIGPFQLRLVVPKSINQEITEDDSPNEDIPKEAIPYADTGFIRADPAEPEHQSTVLTSPALKKPSSNDADHQYGLPTDKSRYLRHLPAIYDSTPFLGRFLLAFEAVWTPIEQTIDHFDLYLDPQTTPAFFLINLGTWLNKSFDATWSVAQQRKILSEAIDLYRARGTCQALQRYLEIYTGVRPEIVEPDDQPYLFSVILRLPEKKRVDEAGVRRIIEANKPAHARYILSIFTDKTDSDPIEFDPEQ